MARFQELESSLGWRDWDLGLWEWFIWIIIRQQHGQVGPPSRSMHGSWSSIWGVDNLVVKYVLLSCKWDKTVERETAPRWMSTRWNRPALPLFRLGPGNWEYRTWDSGIGSHRLDSDKLDTVTISEDFRQIFTCSRDYCSERYEGKRLSRLFPNAHQGCHMERWFVKFGRSNGIKWYGYISKAQRALDFHTVQQI